MTVLNPPKAELVRNLNGGAIDGLIGYVMVVEEEEQSYISIAIPCELDVAESIEASLKADL